MKIYRVIPCHKFTFEYIIWLAAASFYFNMPYFVKQNRELYLSRRIFPGHMYFIQRRITQSVVFSEFWIYKQFYSETLAIIHYELIYFCSSHFLRFQSTSLMFSDAQISNIYLHFYGLIPAHSTNSLPMVAV